MLKLTRMKTLNKQIADKLKEYDSWVVLCHEKTDGDTLGCALALYSLALRLGKEAVVGGKDELPEKYGFLPYSDAYVQFSANDIPEGALLVIVDTSTKKRSVEGIDTLLQTHDSVAIDHHRDNEMFAGINFVNPEASATAEIITRLMNEEFDISGREAECLYTALVTDNGNFRFFSVTPESHETAATLIKAGAKPNEVDDRLNECMTLGALRLWGRAMESTELFAEGKAALFCLCDKDFETFACDRSVTESLVNQLLRITGVKIALFVSEFNGNIKLSVRTKEPYIAREIAADYGGGGHNQAAGASLSGTLENAVAELKKTVTEYALRLSDNK